MNNQKQQIQQEFDLVKWLLNEKQRRVLAWAKAISLWYWWIKIVSDAIGMAKNTVKKWKDEIEAKDNILESDRLRNIWWWRKKITTKNPKVSLQIEKELDGNTIGNPMSSIVRTTKSLSNLSIAVTSALETPVWRDVIARYLHENGYSLQLNKKMIEWWDHVDRDAQFVYIKDKSEKFMSEGMPVLSVDTKKKELVWNFKNSWKVRSKKWEWKKVNVYDFPSLAKGKAVPYWVYEIANNRWRVSVWVSADTGEFSVQSIRSRRTNMWKECYENSPSIYINCDGWWSNWSRCRLRKRELQRLANELQKNIHVSHFPPWTSKRNKIEHRLFCHITNNWKWVPLEEFVTVVNLIGNTRTSKWLTVKCSLDETIYQKWVKVSNEDLAKLNIKKDEFHWERNYIISPQKDQLNSL
jgi:hypothetical protein